MRLPSFVSFILVFLLALFAGGVGYAIGVNSAVVTTTAAAGDAGTVVVAHAPFYGGFWGFPFFGLFFVILFFAVIFGIIRRAAWGGRRGWYGGWHGYGYGYGPNAGGPGATAGTGTTSGSVPPWAEPMLQDWHRHAHTDPNGPTAPTGPNGSTGAPTGQNPPPRG